MKLELQDPKALPREKHYLLTDDVRRAQFKIEFGLSSDVAVRILNMCRTMDQAYAIAELMK